jgi:hypothetical protein
MNADAWITTLLPDAHDVAELDRLRTPVETIQWGVAKRALVLGINVVIDWGFWARDERDHYRAEAEALGAKVVLRYLEVSPAELHRRLAQRNANLPSDTFHITQEQLDLWSTWFQPPTADELI